MERILVHFSANEQKLICSDPFRVSSYKVQYIEAHFDLGQNWSGFDSVRAVWWNDFATIGTVLDSLGVCRVPAEVLRRKGPVMVNLVGSISDGDVLTDRLTTYPVEAGVVDANAKIDGPDPHPATPSQVEQFAAAVREDADRAEQGATDAQTYAQNASNSATSASNSATAAHDDKIAIEEAIAEVIQQIEDFEQVQVVVNTLPPSSQATSDFTDGVLTLGIPQGVKGDTGNGIQSIAKTGTSGLVDTYRITYTDGQTTTFTVTNGAKGDTGNGIQSIAKTSTVGLVDTYTITYTNGTTTTFTVTNGEKGDKGDTGEVSLQELEDATVVQTLSDSTPYNFRRTNNGNGSGTREYDEIVGASVGWNQLSTPNDSAETTYGVTVTPNADGTVTVNGTSNDSGVLSSYKNVSAISGHKYFMCLSKSVEGLSIYTSIGGSISGTSLIRNCESTGSPVVRLRTGNGKTYNNVVIGVNTIDLTLALGPTIADYVYSLETATAGSGVTWLKSHFPRLFDNGYQPFDSGSIKSVSGLEAHEMVGKNLWDEEWEVGSISTSDGQNTSSSTLIRSKNYISVIPNETYWAKAPASSGGNLFYYDADKNYLSYVGFAVNTYYTIPSNARYVRFRMGSAYGTTYKNDICFNISDASIDGQYFPYEKHTYPLDSSVTLRGKYVLDNGQLKAVGDVWKSVGQADRNYNEVDLGTLAWAYTSSGNRFTSSGISSVIKRPASDSTLANIVSANLSVLSLNALISSEADKLIAIGDSGAISVRYTASGTDVATFKQAVSGVKLVYERNATVTETAPTYENPQWCDSHGTEEYVGSELPVGHNTDYPMSLVDTMPTTNGTFEPRVTVTNGVRTVTWVSV